MHTSLFRSHFLRICTTPIQIASYFYSFNTTNGIRVVLLHDMFYILLTILLVLCKVWTQLAIFLSEEILSHFWMQYHSDLTALTVLLRVTRSHCFSHGLSVAYSFLTGVQMLCRICYKVSQFSQQHREKYVISYLSLAFFH